MLDRGLGPEIRRLDARAANRGNDHNGSRQKWLVIQQTVRRLGVSGILGSSARRAVPRWRRCVDIDTVTVRFIPYRRADGLTKKEGMLISKTARADADTVPADGSRRDFLAGIARGALAAAAVAIAGDVASQPGSAPLPRVTEAVTPFRVVTSSAAI